VNASALRPSLFLDKTKAAQCGLGLMSRVGRSVVRHYELNNCDFERAAIRSVWRLQSIASASEIPSDNVKAFEPINEKFLNRERLYQIAPAHLRNSQPASWDDCTNLRHRKQKRFRSALGSFSETCASMSQLVSLAFVFLKINHLRRLPPKQVL